MRYSKWIVIGLLALAFAACGGKAEPTPTKTPRPTATATPLPTLASAALPVVEQSAPEAAAGEPAASAVAEDAVSPIETPTATAAPEPSPTATPGLEAQPPMPVLAADLVCAEGCNAGNPDGVGLAVLNLRTGQFNTWVASLDPLEDQEYEGWVIDASGKVESTGRFNTEEDGKEGTFSVLPGDLKDAPWTSFVLTIEPEPDEDKSPATPHAIGGPFRTTVMGEALYNRFDIACGECHGAAGEGGGAAADAPALLGTSLAFSEFEAAVRGHEIAAYHEFLLDSRDLQHMVAWLTASQ